MELRAATLLPALALCALALAGCPGPGPTGTSFGEPCDDVAQCMADAPMCVAIAAPDYMPGRCASACSGTSCPAGSECRSGACIRCIESIAGTLAAGAECGCDADCASGGFCNPTGHCDVDCTTTPCPTGFSCDGMPPMCVECIGGGPRAEGGMCGCNADCNTGLQCLGNFCARGCAIDEMCGSDECHHELAAPSACGPLDGACTSSGTGAIGAACTCNADCGPIAIVCLGLYAAGDRRFVCSSQCSVEMPCAGGARCCTAPGGTQAYCLEPALAGMVSATCL